MCVRIHISACKCYLSRFVFNLQLITRQQVVFVMLILIWFFLTNRLILSHLSAHLTVALALHRIMLFKVPLCTASSVAELQPDGS